SGGRADFADAATAFSGDRPCYFAACCAARAGAAKPGLGYGDAAALKDEQRSPWRRQAVEWLRRELAYWEKQVARRAPDADTRAEKTLTFWLNDGWLAGVRHPPEVAELPPEEREACRQLWADVAELLRQTRAAPGIQDSRP